MTREDIRQAILDIIGDLALAGMPILGHVRASRSGHGLHTMLLSTLLRDREAWEVTTTPLETLTGQSARP